MSIGKLRDLIDDLEGELSDKETAFNDLREIIESKDNTIDTLESVISALEEENHHLKRLLEAKNFSEILEDDYVPVPV